MTGTQPSHRLELAAAAAQAITQAHFGMVALMEALHEQGAFSSGRRALLFNLRDASMTVPQLAALRPVSRQYVQKLMDEMKREGLVRPTPNPAHRRSPVYELTDAGRALAASMERAETPALERLAAEFDEATLTSLTAALDRARAVMDELRSQT